MNGNNYNLAYDMTFQDDYSRMKAPQVSGGMGDAGGKAGMLAGMGIGSPEMMAVGMGLQVLSQAAQEKAAAENKKKEAEYMASENSLNRQQQGLDRLINIAKGYSNL